MKKLLLIAALSIFIAHVSPRASAQSNPCKASFTYTNYERWTCENDTVFFTNKSKNCDSLDIKYLWDFGDKSYSSTEVNPYYIYTKAPYNIPDGSGGMHLGQTRVILIAYHDHGISYAGQLIHIGGNPPYCTMSISSKNVAKGTSINFWIKWTDDDGSIKEYIWDFGDGESWKGKWTSHTYNKTGIYNVCLNVRNQCGSNKICDTITVY